MWKTSMASIASFASIGSFASFASWSLCASLVCGFSVASFAADDPEPQPPKAQTPPQESNGASPRPHDAGLTSLLYTKPVWSGSPTMVGILVINTPRSIHRCLPSPLSDHQELPPFAMFAPADHVGVTMHESPTLYWHLSAPTPCQVILTLTDEDQKKQIFELRKPSMPGMQQIQTAELGLHLKPEVVYKWSIALVSDPQDHSKDLAVVGLIGHKGSSDRLQEKVQQTDQGTLPILYAETGLWYDAMAAIVNLIDTTPNDPAPQDLREKLLQQGGWK